jgi:hypothetical protein
MMGRLKAISEFRIESGTLRKSLDQARKAERNNSIST